MFSLASTTAIANLIAGYALIYRRAFKVGDRIEVDGTVGVVTRSRLQVTHLRTRRNEEVIVPNSALLNGKIVNYNTYAAEQGLVISVTAGIGYETPWRQVEGILLEAAERTEGVLREPAALRLAPVARRLLRELRAQRRSSPMRSPPGRPHGALAQRARRVQRVRRADHDARVRARPRGAQDRQARGLAPAAGLRREVGRAAGTAGGADTP